MYNTSETPVKQPYCQCLVLSVTSHLQLGPYVIIICLTESDPSQIGRSAALRQIPEIQRDGSFRTRSSLDPLE